MPKFETSRNFQKPHRSNFVGRIARLFLSFGDSDLKWEAPRSALTTVFDLVTLQPYFLRHD